MNLNYLNNLIFVTYSKAGSKGKQSTIKIINQTNQHCNTITLNLILNPILYSNEFKLNNK